MCYNCYQSKGRDKKAWNCEHLNKPHYAKGLCKNCYHSLYKHSNPDKINEIVKKCRIKRTRNKFNI